MSQTTVISLFSQAAGLLVLLTAPVLGLSLVVGLIISIFQAVTSINEATLSYVPKIAAVGVVIALLGPWMLQMMISFTTGLFSTMVTLAHSS